MEPQEAEALKDELLEARDFSSEQKAEPRRNSKQALIDKILEISERDNIPLEHSNTKLKRMNKQQLAELCADMIEKGMKKKMARTIGVDEDADDRCMALGALRMIHDVCAVATERVGDSMLDDYGYTIEGFSQGLKEPTVSTAIDSCLQEIAEENAELLEYVKSPYTRLLIAWGGALTFCCRKRQKKTIKHAANMGPPAIRRQNSLRGRGRGRASHGKKHADHVPLAEDVKTV